MLMSGTHLAVALAGGRACDAVGRSSGEGALVTGLTTPASEGKVAGCFHGLSRLAGDPCPNRGPSMTHEEYVDHSPSSTPSVASRIRWWSGRVLLVALSALLRPEDAIAGPSSQTGACGGIPFVITVIPTEGVPDGQEGPRQWTRGRKFYATKGYSRGNLTTLRVRDSQGHLIVSMPIKGPVLLADSGSFAVLEKIPSGRGYSSIEFHDSKGRRLRGVTGQFLPGASIASSGATAVMQASGLEVFGKDGASRWRVSRPGVFSANGQGRRLAFSASGAYLVHSSFDAKSGWIDIHDAVTGKLAGRGTVSMGSCVVYSWQRGNAELLLTMAPDSNRIMYRCLELPSLHELWAVASPMGVQRSEITDLRNGEFLVGLANVTLAGEEQAKSLPHLLIIDAREGRLLGCCVVGSVGTLLGYSTHAESGDTLFQEGDGQVCRVSLRLPQ